VTVAGDHDFRNGLMLEFYGAFAPPGKRLEYVGADRRGIAPAEWFIAHDFDADPKPAAALSLPGAGTYRLVEVYPYSGLAGWSLILYHRAGASKLAPARVEQRFR
jgi:hypothetical protein